RNEGTVSTPQSSEEMKNTNFAQCTPLPPLPREFRGENAYSGRVLFDGLIKVKLGPWLRRSSITNRRKMKMKNLRVLAIAFAMTLSALVATHTNRVRPAAQAGLVYGLVRGESAKDVAGDAVIGAVAGGVVGALIGGIATAPAGGLGAIPGAEIGIAVGGF